MHMRSSYSQIASVVSILLAANGCNRDTYSHHFDRPLPNGSKLLNYEERRAGWNDMTYGFEFSVPDEVLKNQLIIDWGLREDGHPGGEVDLDKWSLSWWPVPGERSKMEAYSWEDRQLGEYKCLWSDKENERLYIQYGNW